MIFFAVQDGHALACCMAKPMQDDCWELCKLASDKNRPHKGCDSAVFAAAEKWTVEHGAKSSF